MVWLDLQAAKISKVRFDELAKETGVRLNGSCCRALS